MCPTGEKAEKSSGAQHMFNFKVASYHFARLWIKRFMKPADADRVKCLRHLLPSRDGLSLSELYSLLKNLPESVTPDRIRKELSHESAMVESLLETCTGVKDPFDLRGVCMFGLSEMARARRFITTLASGNMEEVARVMSISHEGDRLVRFDPQTAKHTRVHSDYSDECLQELSKIAGSPQRSTREAAALWRQPGRYRCSTLKLDEIVDIIHSVDPSAGAHLAGGGLGGAVVAICRKASVDKISSALESGFYKPHNLPTLIEEFQPSSAGDIILKP
jgi:hypothetical protein